MPMTPKEMISLLEKNGFIYIKNNKIAYFNNIIYLYNSNCKRINRDKSICP